MKKKIEIAYDSEIPLLGIYPEKMIIQKDMHPRVHCSTVYKANAWNAPKCPSTDERIRC